MRIPINEIKIKPRRRTPQQENIEEIAASLAEIGLLNPITVDREHCLVAGLHRLEAAKSLGWPKIECTVCDLDGLWAEMAEIDENYIRLDLSPTEQAEMLLRRKQIYEALHPETKYGLAQVNGMNRAADVPPADKMSATAKSFAEDTAEKLGVDARTVRRYVEIAKNMTPEAKEILKSSEAKLTQKNALKLSKLAPEQQAEAATLLANGQIRSVDEYHTKDAPDPLYETDRAKFAAIVADLKNHDKDCSATPDTFMAQYASFTTRFIQDIRWYAKEYFQPVFPLLTGGQLETLRKLNRQVCAAVEDIYEVIEKTRADAGAQEPKSTREDMTR